MTSSHEFLSGFAPDWRVEDCSRESELIKAAKADPKAYRSQLYARTFYLEHGEFTRSVEYLESARHTKPVDINNSRALALALLGSRGTLRRSICLKA